MNSKLILFIITIIFVGFIVFAGLKSNMNTESGKIKVVASFYPMYFLATEIGGERADVYNVTPAGAEPHDYEPSTRDVARVISSDLFVINGGGAEAPDVWATKIIPQLKNTNVVAAAEGLTKRTFEEDGDRVQDPHVWLDPNLTKIEAERIEAGFEKADPKNAEYYRGNLSKLTAKLDELDANFKSGLSNCSLKDFVTSHAAFGYLAERYGINQIAISGISPEQEPTPKKLAEIADLVKEQNIKVVFFESLVSPRLSDTIANETGAKVMVLDPIEGISDDDMKAGHNYLTVMEDNLQALETALECK